MAPTAQKIKHQDIKRKNNHRSIALERSVIQNYWRDPIDFTGA